MKKILSDKSLHYAALVVVVTLVGFYYFSNAPLGSAETVGIVGNMQVELFPDPPAGTETVTLSFGGSKGSLDLEGWSVTNNGDGLDHVFSDVVLANGDNVQICASKALGGVACSIEWDGGTVWNNTSGTLKLFDADGATVLIMPYTATGAPIIVDVEIDGLIYERNDSVQVCHSTDGSSFTKKKSSAKQVVTGKGAHAKHGSFDIIEPFFYNVGSGFGYYIGLNWDKREISENGCVAP